MSGLVYVHKRWRWDRDIPAADQASILDRVLLLPAWLDGQLEAANLDVKALEGLSGFLRLRVGNFRAIFQRAGKNVILHRVDSRGEVYERLDSLRPVRSGDGLRMLLEPDETTPVESEHRPAAARRADRAVAQNPLSGFTHAELSAGGLTADAIDALRRVPPELLPDEALARAGAAEPQRRLIADMWSRPARYTELLAAGETLRPDLADLSESELEAGLEQPGSMTTFTPVYDAAAFAALLDRPIEDWMVYLHDSQLRAVNYSADGPVRIRGGAGTGKTVVALHRARRFAMAGRSVLLTTFLTNLPKVWSGLFDTFAPTAKANLEMRTVDSVAREICLAAGRLVTPIDGADRHSLISDLWTPHQSQLGGLTAFQLEAEFDYVLIGRDVSTLDEYRQLSRSGRGTALQPAAREVVWRIYGDYRKALTRQGLTSWHEMRRDALEALRAGEVTKGGFQRTSQR